MNKTLSILFVVTFLVTACAGLPKPPGYNSPQGAEPAAPAAPADSGPAALYEHSGPTTAEAKVSLGLDVQRLDTEISAFVWRSVPLTADARCPTGWLCTLHLASGEIQLFVGDGKVRSIQAGTFRFVEAYQSDDAVHTPCSLVDKEDEFGQIEDPTFGVTAGNFSCD